MTTDITDWMYENLRDASGNRVNISSKTLERIYAKYIEESEEAVNRKAPDLDQLNYFSKYLGFESYQDYLQSSVIGSSESDPHKSAASPKETTTIDDEFQENRTLLLNKVFKRRWRLLISLSVFTAIVVSIILWFVGLNNDKLCLVWNETHYESVNCNEISKKSVSIKVDQKSWESDYKDFKRISISGNTAFFDANGAPMVWYVYHKGEVEFYNSDGRHPITNIKLKPVTAAFIENYFESQIPKKGDADSSEGNSENSVTAAPDDHSPEEKNTHQQEKLPEKTPESATVKDNSVDKTEESELNNKPNETKNEPCTSGHLKITNKTDVKIEIQLSDIGKKGPLATFYKTIQIQPGKTGYFYKLEGGVYSLFILKQFKFPETENKQVLVENCKTIDLLIE